MTPILIGVHGVKRAGKDTVAGFIEESCAQSSPVLTSRRRGFADVGKWAFARQFYPHMTMKEAIQWVDIYKVDTTAYFSSKTKQVLPDSDWPVQEPIPSILFRDVLAQFHTEGGRHIYGNDFWVDRLLPQSKSYSYYERKPAWWAHFGVKPWVHEQSIDDVADVCIIADVRFENELQRIKDLNGFAIKVKRRAAEHDVQAEAELLDRPIHTSELGISDKEFDYVIHNDGSLSELSEISTLVFNQIYTQSTWSRR